MDAVRTALVTGASRGVGKGIAIALARNGYRVAITARTVHEGDPSSLAPENGLVLPGSLATTAAEIEAFGGEAVSVPLDLLELDTLDDAVDAAVAGLGGRLDVLVNNAIYVGLGSDLRFADTPHDSLVKRVTGNITAQMFITQRALHHMLPAGGGTVCNVTSAAGQNVPRSPVGEGGWPLAYSVTKAGFHRIADMLVVEYGDQGMRAFNVNPGFVATERVVAAGDQLEFVARHGISPEVIGTAIASLIDDPDLPNGGYVHALDRARELGLAAPRRQS
ncbi:MAG: putative short chain dehydrogenase/reductase [Acidimicrobiales bacterium]|nr:putative short chain dehydrogenase/reductase [Acidimicrobiales bacterium]